MNQDLTDRLAAVYAELESIKADHSSVNENVAPYCDCAASYIDALKTIVA